MKPSEEAIEAIRRAYSGLQVNSEQDGWAALLEVAYAIDVAPLEARIAELKSEIKTWKNNYQTMLDANVDSVKRIKEMEQQLVNNRAANDEYYAEIEKHNTLRDEQLSRAVELLQESRWQCLRGMSNKIESFLEEIEK